MSNICSVYNYQGLSADCTALLQKVKALLITTKGTIQMAVTFVSLAGNKSVVASSSGVTGMLIPITRGYTRNTDDIEENTSNLNYTEKTMDPLPRLEGLATIAACDYKTLFDADGKEFDVQLILNDGIKMGTMQSAGTIKGFRGRIAVKFDVPPSDNAAQSYPVRVYFDDVGEFKEFYIDKMDFRLSELKDVVPAGIALGLNTAYSAGDVILNAKKRCTNTVYTGGFASAAKWEVLESNADDVDVTAVSEANGQYTLTIKKDASGTPANLVSGEYAILQGRDDDGSFFTYLTNPYKVVVA